MGFCLVKGKKPQRRGATPPLQRTISTYIIRILLILHIFTYFASLSFWDFDLAKFGIRARSPQQYNSSRIIQLEYMYIYVLTLLLCPSGTWTWQSWESGPAVHSSTDHLQVFYHGSLKGLFAEFTYWVTLNLSFDGGGLNRPKKLSPRPYPQTHL